MTPEMQAAAYALADILPAPFGKIAARAPRTAQQLWDLAVAVREAEGARLSDAVERITPERARTLRVIDRSQGPGSDQERARAWAELEALCQIDGSTAKRFEARRGWAAANVRGACFDLTRRCFNRYAAWGEMRVTRDLAKMVDSATKPLNARHYTRLRALGLDAIPKALSVWLECVERVRMTCATAGFTAGMAHCANALADVPFVIGCSADPVADRGAFVDRVLAGQDPDVLGRVREYLCEVSPEIRTAAWRVVEGALGLYREVVSQLAFDVWVFPEGVEIEACNGWEYTLSRDGWREVPEMTRVVFVRDRDSAGQEASTRVSIRVEFDDALRVSDISVLDVRTGNELGHAGDASTARAPTL